MKACVAVATQSQQVRQQNSNGITRHSLLKELTSHGVRMTTQRKLLVAIIQQATSHLDAAELLNLAKAKDPEIDRATVYRTIALLKKFGLIDELDLMHLDGEKHFYEAKTNRDHSHLTCIRCGSILEYVSPAFEALRGEIAKRNNFQVKVIRLEVGGVCKNCFKKEKTQSRECTEARQLGEYEAN